MVGRGLPEEVTLELLSGWEDGTGARYVFGTAESVLVGKIPDPLRMKEQ